MKSLVTRFCFVLLAFFALAASVGCRETVANPDFIPCDSGTCGDGPYCDGVPCADGREGEGEGEDGGEGEGEGEGECVPTCEPPRPVCDPADQTCKGCVDDEDCDEDATPRCEPDSDTCVACLEETDCSDDPDGRTLCDTAEHACVACLVDEDCDVPELPRCDAGVCMPCVAGGDECPGACFADIAGTTGDDEMAATFTGACVGCNVDEDCDGGQECDAWTHTCAAPGSANQCEACAVDGDCDDGSRCVEVRYPVGGGVEDIVGTYCAMDCALIDDVDCQINAGRGNHCLPTLTRDGASADFCIPATTTCEAYLAQDDDCSADADLCSVDGVLGLDGECRNLGSCSRCTYPCATDDDCPGGKTCNVANRCTTTSCS